MSCQEEKDALEAALGPARAKAIQCRAEFDNALSDANGSLWQCLGEIGGGMFGGGFVGGLAGAAIGGVAGATACLSGLSDSEKAARSAQACWEEYELLLQSAADEMQALLECLSKRYLS